MKIQGINNNNTNFGMDFRLSGKTLDSISKITNLSVNELKELSISEATRLMKERGSIKEPSKFWQWLSDIYKKFGEKTGLLKKEYTIYSDYD